MTDLLILLWLGDVVRSVSALLGAFGLFGVVMGGVIFAICKFETKMKVVPVSVKALIACAAFSVFVASILPSRQWFYIAAGGTAAVKALDSELGQKVARLVEQKVDEALAGGKQ